MVELVGSILAAVAAVVAAVEPKPVVAVVAAVEPKPVAAVVAAVEPKPVVAAGAAVAEAVVAELVEDFEYLP